MMFLYDNEAYSYDDLLKAINDCGTYVPIYRTNKLFPFFANLVKAMVAGMPLTLIDADVNPSEINGVDERDINVERSVDSKTYRNMEEVVSALQRSKSEITLFTSGSTGQPKKVVHSISTLRRSVYVGEKYAGQIWAYAYNPTHMAGLQVFFQAFENQNTLVNVFGKERAFVYKQIEEKQITHISATPTFYRLLLPYEKSYDSVIRVTLGGEKSDQRLYDAIGKIFPHAKINNVYASTEAGTLFAARGDCFHIPEDVRDKFKVVDDELLIHKSLLGSSESFDLTEDFYHSGDLIEWVDQENGLFRFKSRKNELINVGGYKVNPAEVENAILSIEGVRNTMVYGKTNSVLGNVLCADVQLEEGFLLTEFDIKKLLASQLQDFKIPRRIKFVENIPLTRTGKIKRI